MHQCGDRR